MLKNHFTTERKPVRKEEVVTSARAVSLRARREIQKVALQDHRALVANQHSASVTTAVIAPEDFQNHFQEAKEKDRLVNAVVKISAKAERHSRDQADFQEVRARDLSANVVQMISVKSDLRSESLEDLKNHFLAGKEANRLASALVMISAKAERHSKGPEDFQEARARDLLTNVVRMNSVKADLHSESQADFQNHFHAKAVRKRNHSEGNFLTTSREALYDLQKRVL
jgi:hypothetical protein